jgi:Zn-dependent M32 family carboxypeptidase
MSDDARKLYEELIQKRKRASLLGSANGILGWDERTYMPRGGVEHRASQMALI